MCYMPKSRSQSSLQILDLLQSRAPNVKFTTQIVEVNILEGYFGRARTFF